MFVAPYSSLVILVVWLLLRYASQHQMLNAGIKKCSCQSSADCAGILVS